MVICDAYGRQWIVMGICGRYLVVSIVARWRGRVDVERCGVEAADVGRPLARSLVQFREERHVAQVTVVTFIIDHGINIDFIV